MYPARRIRSRGITASACEPRYARAVLGRSWHGAIAILVLAGLCVQVAIAVQAPAAPPAHAVGTLAGAAVAGRMVRVLSFFTIQSNILAAITSAQLARNPDSDGRIWRVVRLDALFGITVTGIVYTTVLARIHEPKGWEQVSTNVVFHYIVPLATVLGWLAFGPRRRVDARVILWSLVWPVLWFAYTLIRGAASKWYPYPFVDASSHGYPQVLVNALLVTLVLGAVAALFWLGDRKLPSGRQVATARVPAD
jgi:uncharacterized membrane protein